MKIEMIFLRLILASTFIFSSIQISAQTRKQVKVPTPTQAVHPLLTRSQNLGDFLGNLKGRIDQDSFSFLEAQLEGQEKVQLKVEHSSHNQYFIRVGNLAVSFNFQKVQDGQVTIVVNNRELKFESGTTLPEMIEGVHKALPKQASLKHWIWDQFISESQAVIALAAYPYIIAVVGATAAYMMTQTESCANLVELLKICRTRNHQKPKEQAISFIARIKKNTDMLIPITCPNKAHDAVTCAVQVSKKSHLQVKDVPGELRAILNMPTFPLFTGDPVPATKSKSGKQGTK